MYITEVSGHHQATIAIEKSLKVLNPAIAIKNINGFGYAYPIIEKIINKAYMGIIKRTPQIWDYLYDNPKIVKRTKSIKEAIHKANHAKLSKLFDEFQPDAVVCTQAFPCGMVADYKKTHSVKTLLVGVLTDYAPHAYWVNEGVDYYVVPSQAAKERFMKEGVEEEKIKLFGIPSDPKFCTPLDKEAIAQRLGLDSQLPTILIMGGGQGLGPIKDIIKSLVKLRKPLQLIVVAGTNKKLMAWLKKAVERSSHKIIVYEYAHNVEELMTAATLVVTKPGGMTTTEALVKGLPMVIVKPIPGQEMYNTKFLLSQGAAIRVNRLNRVGQNIETLLEMPQCLFSMRQAALANGRANSSMDIARLILQSF